MTSPLRSRRTRRSPTKGSESALWTNPRKAPHKGRSPTPRDMDLGLSTLWDVPDFRRNLTYRPGSAVISQFWLATFHDFEQLHKMAKGPASFHLQCMIGSFAVEVWFPSLISAAILAPAATNLDGSLVPRFGPSRLVGSQSCKGNPPSWRMDTSDLMRCLSWTEQG